MKVGSCFSGIGGLDLGLERAGFEIAWQVEINEYCRKVLARHWPKVTRYGDIRDIDWKSIEPVDVLCGGFPCQNVSEVGGRIGIEGSQSRLWFEMLRGIRTLRPRFVIVENVTGLLNRGIADVLGGLAGIGFDAEWSVFPACALGASHSRERVFFLAYPHEQRPQASRPEGNGYGAQAYERGESKQYLYQAPFSACSQIHEAFASEPIMARVADGIPDRVERNKAIGNAIVPQIAEWLGRHIMNIERSL